MELIRVTFNPRTGVSTSPELISVDGEDYRKEELSKKQAMVTERLVSQIVHMAMRGELDIWKS